MSPSTAPGVTVACAPSESSLPPEVIKAGLMGPRLVTLACYLKGTCHGSYRTVQSFLSEVLGLNLSVGLLAKAVGKMTAALHDSYQELTVALPRQPVLEPTNNATERQIRFVVLDRKVTQGTKGLIGNLWCETIWATIATCRQCGKPIFGFLIDTFNAHIRGKLTPSLIYV